MLLEKRFENVDGHTASNIADFQRKNRGDRVALCLKGVALRSLAAEQERLRIATLTANLERTKILVPIAFRNLRIRVNPEAKMIEVGDTDRPVVLRSIRCWRTPGGRRAHVAIFGISQRPFGPSDHLDV